VVAGSAAGHRPADPHWTESPVKLSSTARRRLAIICGAAALVPALWGGTAVAAPAARALAARAPAPPVACPSCWHPKLDTSWDWVLSTVPVAPYRHVQMYDVDGFDASAADVRAMHHAGIKVVCYLSAGTFEDWRPDVGRFPTRLLGGTNGWPGERWLDVRDAQRKGSVLLAIMRSRLDMCREKGFDGVELDNVDGYTNRTGFPLTAADQLYYDATLANAAHRRGLTVLQKNDNAQIPELLPYFDAALNEQCNQYKEHDGAERLVRLRPVRRRRESRLPGRVLAAPVEVLQGRRGRRVQRGPVRRGPGRPGIPPLPLTVSRPARRAPRAGGRGGHARTSPAPRRLRRRSIRRPGSLAAPTDRARPEGPCRGWQRTSERPRGRTVEERL
jgi:hypothetical protein